MESKHFKITCKECNKSNVRVLILDNEDVYFDCQECWTEEEIDADEE